MSLSADEVHPRGVAKCALKCEARCLTIRLINIVKTDGVIGSFQLLVKSMHKKVLKGTE